jgi:ABC-type polysaccharide/polyol phosphate export permease
MDVSLPAAAPAPSLAVSAWRDWSRSFRMWRLWTALGMEDLSDRYRRTLFGISWVITSFAVFVFVKVVIFGQMSKVSFAEFAMFVTVGFGLWTFINSMVIDACIAYAGSANWLMGTSIPYPVYFLQSIYRNWIVFALTLVVMFAAVVWQKAHWTPTMLWALPGLLVYVITPMWLCAILAPVCLRWRDAYHAMQTIMRLLFFVTPIIWMPGQTPALEKIAAYNPATHFIEIVRQPLVYDTVPWTSWTVVLATTIGGLALGAVAYATTRNRIAFWL